MSNLMPYVVSEFSSHSLIPTIGIVASVMSGVLKLPVARMIDSWGRPQGLAAMILLATAGLVLMAMSTNVKTYAASEVRMPALLARSLESHTKPHRSSIKSASVAFHTSSTSSSPTPRRSRTDPLRLLSTRLQHCSRPLSGLFWRNSSTHTAPGDGPLFLRQSCSLSCPYPCWSS